MVAPNRTIQAEIWHRTGWLELLRPLIWRPTKDEEEDREQLDRVWSVLAVIVISLALVFGGVALVFFRVTRIVDGGWSSVPMGLGQVIGGLVALVLGGRFVPRRTARWTRPVLPSGDE